MDIKNLTKDRVREIYIYSDGDLFNHGGLLHRLKPDIDPLKRFRPIRATKDSHGRKYRVAKLSLDGKPRMILVHRLVWNYFNGVIPKNMVIDHINGNSLDNRIENLQCVTQSENIKRNIKTGAQIEAFEKYCRQPFKSKRKGLYADGDRQYIKLPSGKRRYLTDDNSDELLAGLT